MGDEQGNGDTGLDMGNWHARWIWVVLVVLALAQAARAGEPEYMAVFQEGVKVGYCETLRSVEGGRVRTVATVVFDKDTRGWKVDEVETAAGKPVSLVRTALDGTVTTRVKFRDGTMQVEHERHGATVREEKAFPREALLLEGELQLMKSKGLMPGTRYSYVSFDPMALKAEPTTIEVGTVENVTVLGHAEKLHRAVQKQAGLATTQYLTDQCEARKVVVDLGGMPLEMVTCTKEFALRPSSPLRFSQLADIPLPKDIPAYRDAAALRLVLAPDGTTPLEIPSTDAQTVRRLKDGAFEITVQAPAAPAGSSFPYRGNDLTVLAALKPTSEYQSEDPQVLKAARDAVGDCRDADGACRRLETWVRARIVVKEACDDEDAVTILENGRGNCRQHAILLLTLCRAVGIPTRLVAGVAYVGGQKLSGHAWVECFVGGRWMDYDAALMGFDIGHVALWTGTGEVDSNDLLAKLGHLKVVQATLVWPWYERDATWLAIAAGMAAGGVAVGGGVLWRRRKRAAA